MIEGSTGILEKFAPDKPILIERMKNFSKTVAQELDTVAKIKPKMVDS
jgi:hypothetical protein